MTISKIIFNGNLLIMLLTLVMVLAFWGIAIQNHSERQYTKFPYGVSRAFNLKVTKPHTLIKNELIEINAFVISRMSEIN